MRAKLKDIYEIQKVAEKKKKKEAGAFLKKFNEWKNKQVEENKQFAEKFSGVKFPERESEVSAFIDNLSKKHAELLLFYAQKAFKNEPLGNHDHKQFKVSGSFSAFLILINPLIVMNFFMVLITYRYCYNMYENDEVMNNIMYARIIILLMFYVRNLLKSVIHE